MKASLGEPMGDRPASQAGGGELGARYDAMVRGRDPCHRSVAPYYLLALHRSLTLRHRPLTPRHRPFALLPLRHRPLDNARGHPGT